jgi:probable addiction module antidote protein
VHGDSEISFGQFVGLKTHHRRSGLASVGIAAHVPPFLGDAAFVRDAVGIVARARGMGDIARAAGLNRESLYKALGEAGDPEFATMLGVLRALGLELTARPAKRNPRTNSTYLALVSAPSACRPAIAFESTPPL